MAVIFHSVAYLFAFDILEYLPQARIHKAFITVRGIFNGDQFSSEYSILFVRDVITIPQAPGVKDVQLVSMATRPKAHPKTASHVHAL